MSRSRRKVPIVGNTCSESEKWDKTNSSRKFRRMEKHATRIHSETFPDKRQAGNTWTFSKDGKQYWNDPRAFRK